MLVRMKCLIINCYYFKMSSPFKRILLVKKTTKYERMKMDGKSLSPYIENVLMRVWFATFILYQLI